MNATNLTAEVLVVAALIGLPNLSSAESTTSSIEDPQEVFLWVSVAERGLVERMLLTITVENARQEAAFHLEDINLAGSYLKGFVIKHVQPAPADRYNIEGDETLEYGMTIPARSVQRFYITLEPHVAGAHLGDVDIWGTEVEEEGRFCTARAQTKVE